MTTLAITGASGRMGSRLIALAKQSSDYQLVSALVGGNSKHLSRDAGEVAGIGSIGLPLTADLHSTPQLLIDFSTPAAMRHWLKVCRDRRINMLIGTTGLMASDQESIDEAARDIAVLQAPNTSLGVWVLFQLAAEAAKLLGDAYDIEIVEGHHRFKKDAPSGTAMGLADAILRATDKTRDAIVYDRHGHEALRKPGEIGMHSLRIGDETGRHTAYFAGLGERLELTHVATNRDTFVRGALRVGAWLARQKPGRYFMNQALQSA